MTLDIRAEAEAVRSPSDLARVLRDLRQREAHGRPGPPLPYRQIADLTGLSLGAVGSYLAGVRVPSDARFYRLVEVLGADPAERAALAAARRRLAARTSGAKARPGANASPPQALPAPPTGFTGREDALATLDKLVDIVTRPARFAVITGMPGVGKTALALHWARRAAAGFPDGQLYVDLHAHSGGPPLSTMDALGVLLAALGGEPDGLTDLTARSARYQASLRGQSVLVLLDNVAGVDELRALLPPPPCVAVATSRHDIGNIGQGETVERLTVTALAEREALALLGRLVGRRVAREPEAARALAARCGNLPLALRVAAEHAVSRPGAMLSDLVDELDEEARRLDAFAVHGDVRADLRTVFSWSVRRLPEAVERAFCLMGRVPGLDIDRYGLATLADVDLDQADHLARSLVAAHLVESRGSGRFDMHDLLRAYAAETADQHVSTADLRGAVGRLLGYYVDATTTAVDLMFDYYRHVRPGPVGVDGNAEVDGRVRVRPEFADAAAGAAWLAAERVNLVRACGHAARDGWPREALALALVLGRYLEDLHYEDALSVYTAAAEAMEQLDEGCGPAERAAVRAGLGLAHWRLGRPDLAQRHIESAFDDNLAAGNGAAAARNLAALGVILEGRGRYREAITCQRRALDLARATGRPVQHAIALLNLASAHLRVEDYQDALRLYEQARQITEQAGESWPLGPIHEGMAHALIAIGRPAEALEQAKEAVAAYRTVAQVLYRLRAQAAVGSALHSMGRYAEALEHLTKALAECREHGNPRPTAMVLNRLGETWREFGEPDRALPCHTEALELAERHSDRAEYTRALLGLGDAHAAAGDVRRARDYWGRAYAEYSAAAHPGAARVRARLEPASLW